MMPSARRCPLVAHLGERLVQERVPVPHPDVDGQRGAISPERPTQSLGLPQGQLVERRAAPDQLVVVRDLLEALGGMRRPAATISRNGRMSSGVSGPPKAISRTESTIRRLHLAADSSCTMSTSALTFSTGVSWWTPWPRLKMWPGRPRGAVEDALGRAADLGEARQQHGGIEVALHGHVVAQPLPRRPQLHPPVEADDVAPRFLHRRKQRGRAHPEVDDGHARASGAAITRPAVRQDELAVVGGRERADPRVEELHRLGPGGDLAVQVVPP